jgi:1-acyl-sn-glycerol-3-phosphate acyltransferase
MAAAAQFPAQGWPKFQQPNTPLATRARRLVRLSAHLGSAWLRLSASGSLDSERRSLWFKRWGLAIVESLNVRVVTSGRLCADDRPSLTISNHVSWLDIFVLSSIRGSRFVAKAEVRGWPVVGKTADRFGVFFHVRGNFRDAARTKNLLAAALAAGEHAVVFPEGTTTDGSAVRQFYTAMIQAAIDANAMVQPAALRYVGPDGRRTTAAAFVDDQTFMDSLRLILGESEIVAEVTFGEPMPARKMTRRQLAEVVRGFVAESLGIPKITMANPWGSGSSPTVAPEARVEYRRLLVA